MKYFLIALLLFIPVANAHDCDKSESLVVGDKQIIVKDPLQLLRQARAAGNAKQTSGILVENFGCHPVLEILAKDNDMNCGEFLIYTGIVRDFNEAFDDLRVQLDASQVEQVYRALLQKVVDDIIDQILAPRVGA